MILAFIILIGFSASSAKSFGDATSGPLPNITNISVYNVSDLSLSQKETGGEFVSNGLNSTLTINQSQTQQEYRFTLRIQNEGSSSWDINSSDILSYEGFNPSWNVNKVWYNISQDYDGGSYSNGKVVWNTSKGGILEPGEILYAKFLTDINVDNSQDNSLFVIVNDTSESSGSQDYNKLDVNKLGYLDVKLEDPPSDTILTQNKTFLINSTVTCLEGECGSVVGASRYNSTTIEASNLIPENSGKPFHTVGSNRKICSDSLEKDESCQISWDVNATGGVESYHNLDVNASSSYLDISGNDSRDKTVQINLAVIIDTSWDDTDFGLLDPGQIKRPAKGNNGLRYNISIPERSNSVDNLWIKASELISDLRPAQYAIRPGNISYSFQNDSSASVQISEEYTKMVSNTGSGNVLNTFYWLDVPTGVYKGGYTGKLFFKANSTR